MLDYLTLLMPYEFSWLAVLFFGGAGFLFVRGQRILARTGTQLPRWRVSLFWLGLTLAYAVMHTRIDYFAQFMFFIHRFQHLVLHHLAAILLAAANPWKALAVGYPEGTSKKILAQVLGSHWVQMPYRVLQFPPLAGLIFVGLIFFWLTPDIHFKAMLSQPLYLVMNWSMFLDGILFWWLILDPRSPVKAGTLGFGKRVLLIWFVTVPQLGLGAYIVTGPTDLYDIYDLCGRAWPISPHSDQVLGGALTWIPPGMMGAVIMVVLLRRLLYQPAAERKQPKYSYN